MELVGHSPKGPRTRLRETLLRIATEQTTPARTGLAVAVGVFVGVSPFYGFHLALCLGLATVLGLNRALTYLAAHVSVPWLAPFLIFATVQSGSYILHGRFLNLAPEELRNVDPWSFGEAWIVGWLVLGSLLGAVLGAIAWLLMALYRRRHPLPVDRWRATLHAAADLYRSAGRMAHGFVRGKLDYDPVFRQLLERAPWPSPVIDIGCGRGQALVLLAMQDANLEGEGIDWDAPKLALARDAASQLGQRLRFTSGDIRTTPYPEGKTLLMLDVLHYNPVAVQDDMLRRAAKSLLTGGTLYVRELDAEQGLRAKINMWQERIGCAVRLNRGATLCFRPARELVRVLEDEGLKVTLVTSYGDLPLANVLIQATRE